MLAPAYVLRVDDLGPNPSDRQDVLRALCSRAGTDLFPDAFID